MLSHFQPPRSRQRWPYGSTNTNSVSLPNGLAGQPLANPEAAQTTPQTGGGGGGGSNDWGNSNSAAAALGESADEKQQQAQLTESTTMVCFRYPYSELLQWALLTCRFSLAQYVVMSGEESIAKVRETSYSPPPLPVNLTP